jgi:hypothetical protein
VKLVKERNLMNELSSLSYLPSTSKVCVVDHTLHSNKDILYTLKDNLVLTQNRMKKQANQKCDPNYVENEMKVEI